MELALQNLLGERGVGNLDS